MPATATARTAATSVKRDADRGSKTSIDDVRQARRAARFPAASGGAAFPSIWKAARIRPRPTFCTPICVDEPHRKIRPTPPETACPPLPRDTWNQRMSRDRHEGDRAELAAGCMNSGDSSSGRDQLKPPASERQARTPSRRHQASNPATIAVETGASRSSDRTVRFLIRRENHHRHHGGWRWKQARC